MKPLTSRLASQRLDVLAATVGLLVALALFPVRFLASQVYIETIPILVGTACISYLYARERPSASEFELPWGFAEFARLAPGFVFAGIGLLAVVAALAGRRTTPFFLLTGAVTTLLLLQIIFTSERNLDARIVLAEVLALAFVVRFTALYLNPGFIGFDTWTHVYDYADAVLQERSLSAISEFKYYAAPLYHLLVVATVALLDVSLRHGLFLSVGVLMVVSVVFVYTTARFFVPVKWALVAATLYAVADQVVRWGIYLIPTSMGLFFFTVLVYCLTRSFYTDSDKRNLALLILFSIAIILTHQVSAFIMLVLVGSGAAAQVLVYVSKHYGLALFEPSPSEAKTPVNLLGVLAFDLGFLFFMWSITPFLDSSFLQTVLDWFVETITSSAGFLNLASPSATGGGGTDGPTSLTAELATYADAMGLLLLLFVTVVGCLVAFRRTQQRHRAYTLVGATVITMFFALGLPLFGVRSLLPSRWFAFLYVLMILLGVIGLSFLSQTLPRNAAVALVVVFALVVPTVMMTSVKGTRDNPVFDEERVSYAYTEAEIEAVHTIEKIRYRPGEILYSDHPYWTLFRRNSSYGYSTTSIRFEPNGRFLPRDVMVYRTYQTDPGSQFRDPDGYSKMRTPTLDQVCPPEVTSRAYTNGDVTLCLGTPN